MIYKYSVAGGTINKISGAQVQIAQWHWLLLGSFQQRTNALLVAQGPLKDGWGLTTDGRHLIATDSSSYLIFIDPNTLKVSWG